MLESIRRDFRQSLRSLARQPGFLFVVVLTLGVGIGATTTMFTVFKGVLIDPLPYSDPSSLVRIYQHDVEEPGERQYVTGPHFEAYRSETSSFEEVAALYTYREMGADLVHDDGVERIRQLPVTPGYFEVLGARPHLGRGFARDDGNGVPLAILSHELWRTRFDARPEIIGESIRLDGTPHTVVGVMQPDLEDPVAGAIDAWVPMDTRPGTGYDSPQNHHLTVLARLAPGSSAEQAGSELARLDPLLGERWPGTEDERTTLVPLQADIVRGADRLLGIMMAAVGLVLLVVCVNVANLFLIRATGREREFSIRSALGSGRLRLVRQLLVESLVLAGLGGALGVLLALAGVDLLAMIARGSIPRFEAITVDGAVLAFAAGTAMLTGLVFGVAPAVRFSRVRAEGALRGVGRSDTTSATTNRLRDALAVAQVALALMLMLGAGALITSFHQLGQVELGVRTQGALTFEVNLPISRYDAAARASFHETLAERIGSLPEVSAAGAVSRLPATGTYHSWGSVPRTGPLAGSTDWVQAEQRVVSGDYFDAAGISILDGRGFSGAVLDDDEEGRREVVISRRAAALLFPGISPLGQRLQAGGDEVEVVGVASDVALTPQGDVAAAIYHDHAQFAGNRNWALTQVVGTDMEDPMRVVGAVRQVVADLDPELVVHRPLALADVVGQGRGQTRFATLLLTTFAAMALGLAALGLYGVLGYSVRQRTRELAIRAALGARRAAISRLVLRHGLALVGAGAALGLLGALALGRVLSALVFESAPTDPGVLAGAVATLGAAALLALWLPVRRATSIEPRQALDAE